MPSANVTYISLGTSSAAPTLSRNVSSAAIRWGSGAVWLVDCGEATQHQLHRCTVARTRRVSCVLITHMHGDHVYGLPGLLCSVSATSPHMQVLRKQLGEAVRALGEARGGAKGGAAGADGGSVDGAASAGDASSGGSGEEDEEEAAASILDALQQAERLAEQQQADQGAGAGLQALYEQAAAARRGLAEAMEARTMTLVGPPGLASMVLGALGASYAFLTQPLEVVEMHPAPAGGGVGLGAAGSSEEGAAGAGAASGGGEGDPEVGGAGWTPQAPWGNLPWRRHSVEALRTLGEQYGVAPLGECPPLAGERTASGAARDAAWSEDPACRVLYEGRAGFSANGFCPQLTLRAVGPCPDDGLWHLPLRAGAEEQGGNSSGPSSFVEMLDAPRGTQGSAGASPQVRTVPHGHPKVRAGPLRHPVPSVGYVIDEPSRRGNVQIGAVRPLLERNREAIRASMGVRNPMQLLGRLRGGERVRLPDGAVLDPDNPMHISPPVRGRRLAIFGDTCWVSPQLLRAARGCDLLVHEATNSLTSQDRRPGAAGVKGKGKGGKGAVGAGAGRGFGDERSMRVKTIRHGHSTSRMAGEVARVVGARTVLLNHLSSRYQAGPKGLGSMQEIVGAAIGGMQGVGDDGRRPPPHVDRLRDMVWGIGSGGSKGAESEQAASSSSSSSGDSSPGPGPLSPVDPLEAPHMGPLQDLPENPLLPIARRGRVVCAQDFQIVSLGKRVSDLGGDVSVEIGMDPGTLDRGGTAGPLVASDRGGAGGRGPAAWQGKGKGAGGAGDGARRLHSGAAMGGAAMETAGGGDTRPSKRPRSAAGGAPGVGGAVRVSTLDHLVLTVADVEKAAAFYERVLGVTSAVDAKGRVSLRFGPGGAQALKLHPAGSPFSPHAARPVPGAIDVCFLVEDDVQGVAASLRGAGVEPLRDPESGAEVVRRTGGGGGPIDSVYFRDPDGNLVELSNHAGAPVERAQAPGANGRAGAAGGGASGGPGAGRQ